MPTRRARMRRRIFAALPNWIKLHDFEVLVAAMGILVGVPILLGQVKPPSAEEVLNAAAVRVWASVLVVGSGLVLTGIFKSSYLMFPERIFWMRMESLGLKSIAYFCYLYVICLLIVSGFIEGLTAAAIILALGLVCHVRHTGIIIEIEEYKKSLGLEKA